MPKHTSETGKLEHNKDQKGCIFGRNMQVGILIFFDPFTSNSMSLHRRFQDSDLLLCFACVCLSSSFHIS